MTTVNILLYDGFDEIDAIGPFEVFQNAARYGADVTVELVTLDRRDLVTASHGLQVVPDGVLPDVEDEARPDILVVPGGGWNAREKASAWGEAQKGDVPDALASYHEAGVTLLGVCTGGMLMATAGITAGRRAVTHASATSELRASGAEVVEARVVDDGDVITAGGVTSGIDAALHVVEREFGADVADRVSTTMEYERRTEPYRG